jgi:hypothetical protein
MKIEVVNNLPVSYKNNYNPTVPKNRNNITPLPTEKPSLENIQAYYLNNISFGYKSVLKTEWLKGHMPSVKRGIYGGKLTKKNVTLEHIIPHSKGGKTEISNLALAVDVNNFHRSNRPFKDYFDPIAFKEYIKQFEKVNLPNFNGHDYINKITRVIKRVLRDEGVDLSEFTSLNW